LSATKTQAFVLKTYDYRDTSLLAHFYTKDFGKIHGIIKGVRDARYRYGSTLEPFSLNEILFYRRRRGADLHQVTQVEVVDNYPEVREDLEALSYASYFVDMIDQVVDVEETSVELFTVLKEAMDFLRQKASPRRCARIFEVKLFEILGIMPEFRACVVCQDPDPSPAYFKVGMGGILCQNCQSRRTEGGGSGQASGILVSRGTVQFLEHVRRLPMKELLNVKVAQEVGGELEKMLRRFADFHLPRKLHSVTFLEKMGYIGR
jgi:DNA repair protein RecO (recombination protein O)